MTVKGRLASCYDLPSFNNAVYHANCRKRFQESLTEVAGQTKLGRPPNPSKMITFECLCEYLDGLCDNDLYALEEVHSKMAELAIDNTGDEPNIFRINNNNNNNKDEWTMRVSQWLLDTVD